MGLHMVNMIDTKIGIYTNNVTGSLSAIIFKVSLYFHLYKF